MFGIGFPELIVILVVALVIFGPGKLPEIGSSLGQGLRDFRRAFEGHGDAKSESKTVEDTEARKDATPPPS
jgi:sec-independent protein translocase protein TatA